MEERRGHLTGEGEEERRRGTAERKAEEASADERGEARYASDRGMADGAGAGDERVQDLVVAEAATEDDVLDTSSREDASRKRSQPEDATLYTVDKKEWEHFIARNDIDRTEKLRTIAKNQHLSLESKSKLAQTVHMQQCKRTQAKKRRLEQSSAASAPPTIHSKDGCVHYKRKCRLVCSCCSGSDDEQLAFPCRFCHDNAASQRANPHKLNRYKIEVLECTYCDTRQPVSDSCRNCKVQFSKYSCLTCKLFDDTEPVYHCDKCGLCRQGRAEDNFHCDNCNACISKGSLASHVCVENALRGDCPICKESLYESREKVALIRCGHAIHQHCLAIYQKYGFRCPICFLSMVDLRAHTEAKARASAAEQLPDFLKKKWLRIYCYECQSYSTVRFTFYPRCTSCKKFNTRREELMPDDFQGGCPPENVSVQ
eukprot:Plantae.Rhodophyta-Purpureofilum_apyrenoidigerum.ctg26721.p1 GENE.Plantae.Rhodophyta-Purpureofilum_apyrenoidigerum.ctg26721~~Plantae.Rhodophyta-Purpureofilum_apyrenoidigerum.ctg26721.p1  ORF type:complete len:442 (-),score=59.09 Plantae.Rhodophyta-Purpureofilum_apyrenoidigerum.ctg26721:123-1406(-)